MLYLIQAFEYMRAALYCFFYGKDIEPEDPGGDIVSRTWFYERRSVSDKLVESTITTRTGKEYMLLEHPKTRCSVLPDGCYTLSTYRGKVCICEDGKVLATIAASRFAPRTPNILHVGRSYGNHFSARTLKNSAESLKEMVKDVDTQNPECIIVVTTKKED